MAIHIDPEIRRPASYGVLHAPDGSAVGEIENELQLYDVRIQIAKTDTAGYYIEWKDKRIEINRNGDIPKWPVGYMDQIRAAFVELLNIQRLKKTCDRPEIDMRVDWRHPE